jgi:hypothetical protein
MDDRRFDRLTALLSSDTGRRRALGGLLAVAALTSQSGAFAKKKKKKCTHCPQRACCACTNDNFQTANKCILLETPNAEITLTIASELCTEFCSGTNEQPFGVNDNISGFANFCGADNKCTVKKCPVKLKA